MATDSSGNLSALAISIVGILSTIILLVSYYVFVMRCFIFHRHRHPSPPPLPLRRLPISSTLPSSPRGLDHPTILCLPIVRFDSASSTPFRDCAVCLAEFHHSEKLRLLPACSHLFHMDCIDTWLQTSARCPLCRAPVSEYHGHGLGLVLDVRDDEEEGARRQRTAHAVAMGDECIGVRSKEEPWSVQPIRRSFSMDSSVERMSYLEVQEELRRERGGEEGSSAGVGSGRRMMRLFLSIGQGRSSRRAVMPLGVEDP